MAKIPKTGRWCRAVFKDKTGQLIDVDFGYYSASQRLESIARLRKQHSDMKFVKAFVIPAPSN